MFGGANRQQHPQFFTNETELRLRPYNRQLSDLTSKVCQEVGLSQNDVCLFETRLAFDCVLRGRVQKMGAITDNIGACRIHINTMKDKIEGEGPSNAEYRQVIDRHMEKLQYATRSFV